MTGAGFFRGLALAVLLCPPGAARAETAACDLAPALAALDARDADALDRAARNLPDGCGAAERQFVMRLGAYLVFDEVAGGVAKGEPLAGFEDRLKAAQAEAGGPWQVLDALGDIARARGDFAAAYGHYHASVADAADTVLTPDWMAPDAAYIRRLVALAAEMQLASGALERVVRCPCAQAVRGVPLMETTLPDPFEGAALGARGGQALGRIMSFLAGRNTARLTIEVHADTGAGADADRALSVTRANLLSDEIRKAGFTGTIETRGRGADEPYRPVENDVYDDPAVLSRLANRLILRLAD